jgi:hypothetical protein
MNKSSSSSDKPKGKGLPLWTALVALLLLAVVAIGALGALLYFSNSRNAKLLREQQAAQAEKIKQEIAAEKVAGGMQLAMAQTRQEEVRAHARTAIKGLETLMTEASALLHQADELQTNEIGIKVARHPDLVAHARRFYEVSLPKVVSISDIAFRLEGVRRIELKLSSAAGTTYQPEPEFVVTAQNSTLWAEQAMREVREAQNILSTIVQDSQIKVDPTPSKPNAPSLASAIELLTQAESSARQRALLAETSAAEKEVEQQRIGMEADLIRKRGTEEIMAAEKIAGVESENRRKQAEEQARAAKALADAELARKRQETDNEAARLTLEAQEKAAEAQRFTLVKAAESQVADSRAQATVLRHEDEAQRILLRERASDPKVQAMLAPFTTHGYWMPRGSVSLERQPHSFTSLKSYGALEPTEDGLRKLAEVARAKRDTLRPRVPFSPGFLKIPDQLEKAKETQRLLRELGPVLVEMGMLAE